MNGSDLLVYSQMIQHQTRLLEEAEVQRIARAARQARHAQDPDPATGSAAARAPVDPQHVGVLRPGIRPRAATRGAVRGQGTGASGHDGRRSTPLSRVAARFGSSLVAVGRRLERLERR